MHIENMYIVLPHISKISNEVGRIDNFLALRKLSFLPTELDIFDIRQHYIRIYGGIFLPRDTR